MFNTKEQGYFAADTRLVSGYRLKLGGEQPILLNGAASGNTRRASIHQSALVGSDGHQLPEHSLHLRLDRSVGLRSTRTTTSPTRAETNVVLDLEMSIESDFADLFDVKGAPARQTRLHPQLVGRREPTAHPPATPIAVRALIWSSR